MQDATSSTPLQAVWHTTVEGHDACLGSSSLEFVVFFLSHASLPSSERTDWPWLLLVKGVRRLQKVPLPVMVGARVG